VTPAQPASSQREQRSEIKSIMTMDWHFSSEESVVPSNRPALHSADTLHLETKPTNEDNGLQPGCLHTVIPGRLCLVAHRDDDHTIAEIKKNPKVFFFSSELHEMYTPYCADFGPVNLSIVYHFCNLLKEKLADPRIAKRQLAYYCSADDAEFTNTAFLLGAYLVLVEEQTPEQVASLFAGLPAIMPFRDATFSGKIYPISLLDCFRGLRKATEMGWFSLESFRIQEYEFLDCPFNGDIHQPCPRFLAFRGPTNRRKRLAPGFETLAPKDYVPIFRAKKVSAVVRLNENEYEGSEFEEHGINHYDLSFPDCSVPSLDIVERFLDLMEKEQGVVAVHCKAGLGRTGTLIALWMMRHHKWGANEAIAWLRIVRPGCVVGPQQRFLKLAEAGFWEGNRLVLAAQQVQDCYDSLPVVLAEEMGRGAQRRCLRNNNSESESGSE